MASGLKYALQHTVYNQTNNTFYIIWYLYPCALGPLQVKNKKIYITEDGWGCSEKKFSISLIKFTRQKRIFSEIKVTAKKKKNPSH